FINSSPARADAGAHFPSKTTLLQPEIAERSSRSTSTRTCRKICENLSNLWLIPSPSAPVAQLDRALASGAKGCGFDPRRAHGLGSRRRAARQDAAAPRRYYFRALEKSLPQRFEAVEQILLAGNPDDLIP